MHRVFLVRRITAGALKTTAFGLVPALFCAVPASAQQQQLRTEWSRNVTEFRGQNDRRVTLVCPPGGKPGDIWGTDSYTDDSSVCAAAAHAGVIGLAKGGVVTIVIGPGGSSYAGSTRNGVTSQRFGRVPGSFSFERGAAEGQVDWMTSANGLSLAGGPVTVVCPPGGKNGSVWGTDRYTDDSSICSAAVHAGRITSEKGGRVTISSAGAQASYSASERNGVSSQAFADWPNSFQVSDPAAARAIRSTVPIRAPVATAPAAAPMRTGRTPPISREATSITLSATSATIEQGATQEISAVTDTKEVGQGISWQSSNPAVASVNSEGMVTGVEVGGPVTITAMSGAARATATVTVSALPPDPGGGTTYPFPQHANIAPGSSRVFRGYFASTNDTDRWYRVNVSWPQPSGCTAGAPIGLLLSVNLTGIPAGRQYDLFLKKDHTAVLQEGRPAGNQDRSLSVSGTCGTSNATYYVQVHRTDGLPSRSAFTLSLAEGM